MKKTKALLVAAGLITAILTGCQTAPMTARSRLSETGSLVVVEKTTTTHPDGRVETVEKSTTKSPSAGDLEIKKAELHGRTKVGTARANASQFWQWLWTPSYPYGYGGGYSGGYYGGGYVSPPPCDYRGGAYGGNIYYGR